MRRTSRSGLPPHWGHRGHRWGCRLAGRSSRLSEVEPGVVVAGAGLDTIHSRGNCRPGRRSEMELHHCDLCYRHPCTDPRHRSSPTTSGPRSSPPGSLACPASTPAPSSNSRAVHPCQSAWAGAPATGCPPAGGGFDAGAGSGHPQGLARDGVGGGFGPAVGRGAAVTPIDVCARLISRRYRCTSGAGSCEYAHALAGVGR